MGPYYELLSQGLICPNCSARNRTGANYCDNCGRRLQQTCAGCGNRSRLGANYCDNCGRRFESSTAGPAALPVAEPSSLQVARPPEQGRSAAGLSSYIPKEFASRLEAARSEKTMVGERRIVTFLFCDMVGSTSAAGEMDPEEWAEIVNDVFEIIVQGVLNG